MTHCHIHPFLMAEISHMGNPKSVGWRNKLFYGGEEVWVSSCQTYNQYVIWKANIKDGPVIQICCKLVQTSPTKGCFKLAEHKLLKYVIRNARWHNWLLSGLEPFFFSFFRYMIWFSCINHSFNWSSVISIFYYNVERKSKVLQMHSPRFLLISFFLVISSI